MLTSHPPGHRLITGTARVGLAALLAAAALAAGPSTSGLAGSATAAPTAGSQRVGVASLRSPATLPRATTSTAGSPLTRESPLRSVSKAAGSLPPVSNGEVATAPLLLQAWAGTSLSGETAAFGTDQAGVAPPDPDVAVSGQWVVETTNQSLYVRQRGGSAYPDQPGATCPPPGPGAPGYAQYSLAGCDEIDLNNFVESNGWQLSDPRIVYDPGAGQFYLSFFVTTRPNVGTSCLPGYPEGAVCSRVYLFHTEGGDPTGQWEGYFFDSYYADTITDQPMVGFSADKIGVSWDEFNVANSEWVGDEYFVLSKATFLANATGSNPVIDPASGKLAAPTMSYFSLFPVPDLSSGATLYFISNNGSEDLPKSGPGPSVYVLAVTGNSPGTIAQTTNYPLITETSAPPAALQKGSTDTIDTDDDRIDGGVWSNGILWTGVDDACTSSAQSCITYIEINTTTFSVLEDDNYGASGTYVYYPSFGIDPDGDLMSSFTSSSSTSYPTVMAIGLAAGQTLLSTAETVVAGSGPYADPSTTDGVCSVNNDPITDTVACRYGDYGAGAMDPEYPEDFWFVNEVQLDAASSSDWGTEIGELTYSGPSITAFDPAVGPTTGGVTVTVSGSDFAPGTTFSFNGAATTISNLTPESFIFIPPAHAAGTVTGAATDSFGTSSPATSYLYVGPSRYQPLAPYRVLDTRSATCVQCTGGSLGPGQTRTIQVGGYTPPGFTGTIVPATATAVVLNLTAVNGSSGTFLTVYPAGGVVPNASNINPPAGDNIANLTTVALGSSGAEPGYVSIYNSLGTIDVVADVEGYYFSGGSGSSGEFHALSPPVRVCDSRGDQGTPGTPCAAAGGNPDPLAPGETRLVAVTDGTTGVSTSGDAAAVVANLTAVSGTAGTLLTVYPPTANGANAPTCGTPPTASNLNVAAVTNQPNRVISPVVQFEGTGYLCVYNDLGTINFILDVNGWFGNGSDSGGALFYPLGPSRICDTRFGSETECAGRPVGPASSESVQVAGVGPLPAAGMVALVANVTAVNGSAGTFLTVYPDVASPPVTSDLNPPAGLNIANLVIVAVAADGKVDVYNSLGSINFIIDAVGWFQ
ncbi:MAG: IPT/TIG domain-containing protein [Candidatus Dormibacteria bacterium]|jgi:hypothetical protein